MNFYEHFYPYVKDLLCREEEADAIMKAAKAINSLNPSKQSEAEMIMFIEDQFANLLYGTGHDYNYPGYKAVYELYNSLKNIDSRVLNYHIQISLHNIESADSPSMNF